jgi:hypothetical protein
MAYARRKIHDMYARAPTDITTEALQRIGELDVIEAEVRGWSGDMKSLSITGVLSGVKPDIPHKLCCLP